MAGMQDVASDVDFDKRLSETPAHTVLVLNFFATWASPCEQTRSILSDLASSYAAASTSNDTVSFLNLNAEDLPDVSERYNVSAVPYLVLLKNGKVLETVSGSDATNIRTAIERHVGKPGTSTNGPTAAQLPPEQKIEKPEPTANGATPSKDLSGYAPTASDPSTAPEMSSAELPEGPASSHTEELHARLTSLVSAAPVMLFMKGTPSVPQCGFSRQLVGLLRERGVRYGFFNILADEEVRQGLKEFADWPTFPQLWVKGELVGGLDIVKEEISSDPEFLKDFAVKRPQGSGGGGPGKADAKVEAPTPA